ncbi:helix-turn-helix transcriptional regulator [Streptomyces sp. NPDC002324]
MEEVIGERIAGIRADRQMSQAELGEALATYLEKPWSRQAVYTAEKGKRAFTAAELVALALVLEVEVPDLMAPGIQQKHESVELPGGAITAKQLAGIVAPEPPGVWERRANMRMVADITPMLGGAIQTLQILQASLQGILADEEERAAVENPESLTGAAKKHVELRTQLTTALADLIGRTRSDEERYAAMERLKVALKVASGEVEVDG